MENNRLSNLEILTDLLSSRWFHHASYKSLGTLHEGLWVYRRSVTGFRGFEVATAFLKNDPNLETAENMVRGTGVSVGAYGRG